MVFSLLPFYACVFLLDPQVIVSVKSEHSADSKLQSQSEYVRLIEVLERVTAALNGGEGPLEADPERLLEQLQGYAPLLAHDQDGQKTRQSAYFALARLALSRGEESRARALIDSVVADLGLAGELDGFAVEGCGSRTDQAARTTARRRCRSVSAIASVQRSLRRKARSWTMCSPECSCQRAPGRFILNAIRLLHVASTAPEPSGRPSALALA